MTRGRARIYNKVLDKSEFNLPTILFITYAKLIAGRGEIRKNKHNVRKLSEYGEKLDILPKIDKEKKVSKNSASEKAQGKVFS